MAFIIPDGTGWTMATPTAGAILHKSGTTIGSAMFTGETFVKITQDVTTTANTYQNITNLVFSVAASTNYYAYVGILYQSNTNTTTGIGLSATGPASPTSYVQINKIANGSTGAVFMPARHSSTYGGHTAVGLVTAINVTYYAVLAVYFKNGSNAGSLQMTFRSEINGDTVTIKAGSCLAWRQVV